VPVEPPRDLWPGLPLLHGFFVHLEWDANTHHTELRFVLDLQDATRPLLPVALHVQEAGGIASAFARTLDVSAENLIRLGEVEAATTIFQHSAATATALAPALRPLVALTLYLCSATAEVRDARGSAHQPVRPQPTRTKKGVRLFPPPQPTTWEVAYRLGAALRRAQQLAMAQTALDALVPAGQDDQGGEPAARLRPRAHIRRAHWHTYWVGEGSRTDPSKAHARVRWLPPIPVGLPDELIPTIRPVT
jgi:hypothetical protein